MIKSLYQHNPNLFDGGIFMQNKLQQYFPTIRTEKELLNEINNNPKLLSLWNEWSDEHQEEFLQFLQEQNNCRRCIYQHRCSCILL